MREVKNDTIDELDSSTKEAYDELSRMNESSIDKNIIDGLSKEIRLIIVETAKDLYHDVINKEDAIDRVKRAITKVTLGPTTDRGKFIYKKLKHKADIVHDEIDIYRDKLRAINEYDEIDVSDDQRNKLPWEIKDKLAVGTLIIFIFIIFIFEIFTSGQTLRSKFLLFADKTLWAYSLGVLFGFGGIGIKLWGYGQAIEVQKKINTSSFFILFIGLVTFIFTFVLSQFSSSGESSEIILDYSKINLSEPEFAWIAFILVAFTLVSFGLLQILTGTLISKWNKHGDPVTTIYRNNIQYKYINKQIAKLTNIQNKIEQSIDLYLQIIENDENKSNKIDVTAETILFSQFRKLKIAKEKADEANKL